VPSRKDNIDIIRGMALSTAATLAKDEAVRTELEEDFDNEQLKIRVRIGKRSAVFAVYNADVEPPGRSGGSPEGGAADSGGTIGAGALTLR
jgi:hypothetical protein